MFVILSKKKTKNQKRWKKLRELLAIIFTLFTEYKYIAYFHMKNACRTAIVNNKRCTLHMPNYLMINIFFYSICEYDMGLLYWLVSVRLWVLVGFDLRQNSI